jgi:hypothetical protein
MNVKKFMERTLVVVDMQPHFKASQSERVIMGVKKEIINAIENSWPIIFVEYTNCGHTHESLIEIVNKHNYINFVTVTKRQQDGSKHVLEACETKNYPKNKFRVVGLFCTF